MLALKYIYTPAKERKKAPKTESQIKPSFKKIHFY